MKKYGDILFDLSVNVPNLRTPDDMQACRKDALCGGSEVLVDMVAQRLVDVMRDPIEWSVVVLTVLGVENNI